MTICFAPESAKIRVKINWIFMPEVGKKHLKRYLFGVTGYV